MAKEYTGFPISNFRTGFDEALEPWLVPRDAFQLMKNCHLYRGVIEKIPGYNIQTRMSYRTLAAMTGTIDGVNKTFTYQIPGNIPPRTAGTVIQSAIAPLAANKETFTDNGNGILTGSNGGSGTINYAVDSPVVGQPAGYVTVTFGTAPVDLTVSGFQFNSVIIQYDGPTGVVSGDYNTSIMGIKQYENSDGSQEVLIFNTRRMGILVNLTGAMLALQQLDYGIQEVPHETQTLNVVVSPVFDGITVGPFLGDVTTLLTPGTVRFYLYDSSATTATLLTTISDNGSGYLTDNNGYLNPTAQNFINYATGKFRLRFDAGHVPLAAYQLNFAGCIYGDTFTGDYTDFFDVANYLGYAFVTNAIDPPRYYDGACLHFLNTNLTVKPNTIAPYDLSKVLHLAIQRERLLLISVYENNLPKLSTIYWSSAGAPLDFTNAEFLPAPTSQKIVAISVINTDLIVRFTNSERVFRYTSDAFAPFRWDTTNSIWRCDAPFSPINYDSWFSSIGSDAIVGSDGVNVRRVDEIIPDFTLNQRIADQQPVPSLSQTSIGQCYGERYDDFKEGWLCYRSYDTGNGGILPSNNVLAFSYLDDTYAIYTFPFTVLGFGRITTLDTWADAFTKWSLSEFTWDSYIESQNALINLAGDQNGNVFQIGDGNAITSEDGTVINCLFELISKDFNPFIEDGELARFGYVDFLLSSNAETKLRVQFYKDNQLDTTYSTYYQETTIQLIPTFGQTKIWKRIYVGAVGREHTMRIYQNEEDFVDDENQPIRIHSIVPYFKAAGRIFG